MSYTGITANMAARPEICVPECRFYGETGRFENDELVAEHKKIVEFYNKHNAIIEIKIQDDVASVSSKCGSIVMITCSSSSSSSSQMKITITHNQSNVT